MTAGKGNVLISGASFAGLAAAYWMKRLGYAVTVVEVAKALRKGGTPVDIKEGVIDVVKRMGLFERIVARSLKPRPMTFLDGAGEAVARMLREEEEEAYEIERDVLLEMLFDLVKDDVELLFEESIAAFEETADEVSVTFASGARRAFSLVLGCDGTHSAVRRLCFGAEAEYMLFMKNYFSLTIVNKMLIAEDTNQMFNVPGKTVMLNSYKGKTDIAFCFSAEQEIAYDRRDRAAQKQMVREHFQGEGWRIPELLAEIDECDDFYFDKLCQIRMDSWSRGRVALVGDAGYCPSPTAGMGGSMALLGAAALGDALAKYSGDLPRAFAEYEESFRGTVKAIQDGAIEFGLEMVMPGSGILLERSSTLLRK